MLKFADLAIGAARRVSVKVEEARESGFTVAGYGAAAKGNTILNFGGITLDFIVDDNPLKQGKHTPGMRIPILSPCDAESRCKERIAWVVLSWNFTSEIKDKINKKFSKYENEFIQIGFES